jgi:hypothetical protein
MRRVIVIALATAVPGLLWPRISPSPRHRLFLSTIGPGYMAA